MWRCGWDGAELVFEAGFTAVPTSSVALTALEAEFEVGFPFQVSVHGPGSEAVSVSPGNGSRVLPAHQRALIGSFRDVRVRVPVPHRDMILTVDLFDQRVCEVKPFADLELDQ